MPIGINNLGNNIRIGNLAFIFLPLKLLHQLSRTGEPKVLIKEPAARFGLATLDNIHLVEHIDMRHLHVDHRGQGHHAQADELADIVHVSAVEKL